MPFVAFATIAPRFVRCLKEFLPLRQVCGPLQRVPEFPHFPLLEIAGYVIAYPVPRKIGGGGGSCCHFLMSRLPQVRHDCQILNCFR